MNKIFAFSIFTLITLLSAFSMACVLLYENPTCITFIVASFAVCVALLSIYKIIKHL